MKSNLYLLHGEGIGQNLREKETEEHRASTCKGSALLRLAAVKALPQLLDVFIILRVTSERSVQWRSAQLVADKENILALGTQIQSSPQREINLQGNKEGLQNQEELLREEIHQQADLRGAFCFSSLLPMHTVMSSNLVFEPERPSEGLDLLEVLKPG